MRQGQANSHFLTPLKNDTIFIRLSILPTYIPIHADIRNGTNGSVVMRLVVVCSGCIIQMGGILGETCSRRKVGYQPEEYSQRLGLPCKACNKNLSYERSISPCKCYLFCHEQCFTKAFVKHLHAINTEVRCLVCETELDLRLRSEFTYDPKPTMGKMCRLLCAWLLLVGIVVLIIITLGSSTEKEYVYFATYVEGILLSLILYWLVLIFRDILYRQTIVIAEVVSTKLDIQTSAFQQLEMDTHMEMVVEHQGPTL